MPPKRIALVCQRCGVDFLGAPYARKPGDPPQRFCSRRCRDAGPLTDLATRFWSGVDRSDLDGCWPWTRGQRNEHGYGGIWDGEAWTYAHIVAYRLAIGPVPDGLEVCHSCDNPPCCRPDHLFAGTHAQNMADMAAKRRAKRVSVVVEESAIIMIRCGMPQRLTGKALGIAKTTVARITRRAHLVPSTYRHGG